MFKQLNCRNQNNIFNINLTLKACTIKKTKNSAMAVSPSEFIDWKQRLENLEHKFNLNKPEVNSTKIFELL